MYGCSAKTTSCRAMPGGGNVEQPTSPSEAARRGNVAFTVSLPHRVGVSGPHTAQAFLQPRIQCHSSLPVLTSDFVGSFGNHIPLNIAKMNIAVTAPINWAVRTPTVTASQAARSDAI